MSVENNQTMNHNIIYSIFNTHITISDNHSLTKNEITQYYQTYLLLSNNKFNESCNTILNKYLHDITNIHILIDTLVKDSILLFDNNMYSINKEHNSFEIFNNQLEYLEEKLNKLPNIVEKNSNKVEGIIEGIKILKTTQIIELKNILTNMVQNDINTMYFVFYTHQSIHKNKSLTKDDIIQYYQPYLLFFKNKNNFNVHCNFFVDEYKIDFKHIEKNIDYFIDKNILLLNLL